MTTVSDVPGESPLPGHGEVGADGNSELSPSLSEHQGPSTAPCSSSVLCGTGHSPTPRAGDCHSTATKQWSLSIIYFPNKSAGPAGEGLEIGKFRLDPPQTPAGP